MSNHDDARFFNAIYNEWTQAITKAYANHGVFWAFNDEQFKEGINRVRSKGLLAHGEKLMRMSGGGFLPESQADKLTSANDLSRESFINAISDLNLERAEVVYHLNNQEFFYLGDWDGIKAAIGSERFDLAYARKVYQEELDKGSYDNY